MEVIGTKVLRVVLLAIHSHVTDITPPPPLSTKGLNLVCNVRGASKIKLKKVNKKRAVTVRRVNIFLNISRHPLLI